jgi:hypothetical protein
VDEDKYTLGYSTAVVDRINIIQDTAGLWTVYSKYTSEYSTCGRG